MMRVLCYDDLKKRSLFVFDVIDAYFEPELPGLVLSSANPEYDMFCIRGISQALANSIILELYRDGSCDLRSFGEVDTYSDEDDIEESS